jgi:hypothetical protein
MIAFIKLEKSDFENATKYADECLALNPKNIFAEYISALSTEPANHCLIRKKMRLICEK